MSYENANITTFFGITPPISLNITKLTFYACGATLTKIPLSHSNREGI